MENLTGVSYLTSRLLFFCVLNFSGCFVVCCVFISLLGIYPSVKGWAGVGICFHRKVTKIVCVCCWCLFCRARHIHLIILNSRSSPHLWLHIVEISEALMCTPPCTKNSKCINSSLHQLRGAIVGKGLVVWETTICNTGFSFGPCDKWSPQSFKMSRPLLAHLGVCELKGMVPLLLSIYQDLRRILSR